jgi:hypothetical protein
MTAEYWERCARGLSRSNADAVERSIRRMVERDALLALAWERIHAGTATPAEVSTVVGIDRYAWPGGYALYGVTDDGGALCAACCRKEGDVIAASAPGDGWHVTAYGCTVNDDDVPTCDHCGAMVDGSTPDPGEGATSW